MLHMQLRIDKREHDKQQLPHNTTLQMKLNQLFNAWKDKSNFETYQVSGTASMIADQRIHHTHLFYLLCRW